MLGKKFIFLCPNGHDLHESNQYDPRNPLFKNPSTTPNANIKCHDHMVITTMEYSSKTENVFSHSSFA